MLTALALILLGQGMLRAQATPDLSGTWTLDAAKSDPEPAPPARAGGAGGRAGRGGAAAASDQLAITQTPSDVVIRQGIINMPYKTDGTETFYVQQGEIRATAKWEGDKFVVSWKKELYAGPKDGYVTTTGKDIYTWPAPC
jgi:hypothetical protein